MDEKRIRSGSRKEPLKETHSNQRNPRDGLCGKVSSSKQTDELARILEIPRTERSSRYPPDPPQGKAMLAERPLPAEQNPKGAFRLRSAQTTPRTKSQGKCPASLEHSGMLRIEGHRVARSSGSVVLQYPWNPDERTVGDAPRVELALRLNHR
jgi:hypothetical protein